MSQKRVAELIRQLYRLDEDIEKAEATLNRMKAKRAMVATVDLPEAMTEIGSSHFTTDDHYRCEVAFKIYGSLPSRENLEARANAIDYLLTHEGEALVKSNVKLTFEKGDIRSARKTFRALQARIRSGEISGAEYTPSIEVDTEVHPQSLQAWGRARVKDNIPTDLAAVGLRGMTIASVKLMK